MEKVIEVRLDMRYLILFVFLNFTACQTTLKEQYSQRVNEIAEYCQAVFDNAGYDKRNPPKKYQWTKCVSQTEDREQIKGKLDGIYWSVFGIYAVGLSLVFF